MIWYSLSPKRIINRIDICECSIPYAQIGVFWLNIAKNGVYWCYRYWSKLLGKMRKEIEFRQRCCQNCKKKYNVLEKRENWISVMRLPKLLSCPSSTNEWIVATKLPKIGGIKKKKRRKNCGRKWEEKRKEKNCGNKVAKNEGKKMLHSQHFYNKLEVVSCYWFKFEPNTKITFLPQ